MFSGKKFGSYLTIIIVQVVTLLLLSLWMPGLQIESIGGSLIVLAFYLLSTLLYWWLFLNFLSQLPYWFYPIISGVLAGGILMVLSNLVPGILVADLNTALRITIVLAGETWFLAGYFSLDLTEQYDRRITRPLVAKLGKVEETNIPGLLMLEIDGLSEKVLKKALEANKMPTLRRWIEQGSHIVDGWETDYSAQTGASQSGILLGNNDNIPAYRWWDRQARRMVRVGNYWDANALEVKLTNGEGLLSHGGASRNNLFSGDAGESFLTMSTILTLGNETGPGFYLHLLNPFIVARIAVNFIYGVLREWGQALWQRLRRDKLRVRSRNFMYGFIRAGSCQFLQDVTTFVLTGDILRGLPTIYATYLGYDDVAHYTGVDSTEAFQTLAEIDRQFARLEHILEKTPRPYHVIVLSDHGQSTGGTFEHVYGINLKKLVTTSIQKPADVTVAREVSEAWERIDAFLSDSSHKKRRMVNLLRTMWESRAPELSGKNAFNPPNQQVLKEQPEKTEKPAMAVFPSGCSGLIYFTGSKERLTYEEIQNRYPNFLLNLLNHPGIGFVLVRSVVDGDVVMSKDGVYFLDSDYYEGENPLANYSSHAPSLLRRESTFPNCADILISTRYDPTSESLCGFEDQIGHHGGLGGQQSKAFLIHPKELKVSEQPIVGAEAVYRVLKDWRDTLQNSGGQTETNYSELPFVSLNLNLKG